MLENLPDDYSNPEDLTVDRMIGRRLETMWSGIIDEPLPEMLLVAVAVVGLGVTAAADGVPAYVPETFEFSQLYAAIIVAGVIPGIIVLYLIKSFMGIDLFEGPSFLHDFFFD